MKYRLYENSKNDTSNVLKEVLKNRGIDNYYEYLNLKSDVVIPYSMLDNIDKAVKLFMTHFENKKKIEILVDSDPDGYCSAAMIYSYIKQLDNSYPVGYILHKRAKSHGLDDDVAVSEDTKLLIIPDAGTNDVIQCKTLNENGIDILILDHHEAEEKNPYALIVNNQMSANYTNKSLCGAGVVYKFLQALDSETWNEFADDYLDLCALANISDVMDMRSFETRYLTDVGLSNITNKCFQALIKSQDYSINDKIDIHNIQWYITPILNGMIRVGSFEDKELLFKAFIEQDEVFEYKKRATKNKPAETIQENIYDRAARLCKNAKSRQDKLKEKGVKIISEIASQLPDTDKVIILDTTEYLDGGLTGVAAIKIAEQYNKPCILLKKYYDKKTDSTVYGGSARNVNHSPIDSFKDIVNSTEIIQGKGHPNAFGIVDLPLDNIEKAMKQLNILLKDIEYDSTYKVDFILDINHVTIPLIIELSKFENIVGQGIEEPMIAVENISLTRNCFEVFGKNEDTISFMINGIKYVQFKCKEGNRLYDFLQNAWDNNDGIIFTIVGKPTINEYNGIRTPQIIIEDVNVINTISQDDNGDDW